MNVLLMHQSAELYGSDRMLLEVVRAVSASDDNHCIVLLPEHGPLIGLLELVGAEVHVVDTLKIGRSLFAPAGVLRLIGKIPASTAAVERLIGERPISLVYSNTIAVLLGAVFCLNRKIPHVWHVHEIIRRPMIVSAALRLLVKFMSSHVLCASPAVGRWMDSGFVGRCTRSSIVVENGVGIDATTDEVSGAGRLVKSTVITLGLIGRINAWKGHFLLVDAIAALSTEAGLPPFKVVFVGGCPPGSDKPLRDLIYYIKNRGVEEIVNICPFSENVTEVYRSIDICCVPSTEPEPFGLVAIEAMAHGLPVVASAWGGLADIIVDGATGQLFEPCSATALASALRELLLSEDMRASMGKKGRERYLDYYSSDAYHARLRVALDSIAKK